MERSAILFTCKTYLRWSSKAILSCHRKSQRRFLSSSKWVSRPSYSWRGIYLKPTIAMMCRKKWFLASRLVPSRCKYWLMSSAKILRFGRGLSIRRMSRLMCQSWLIKRQKPTKSRPNKLKFSFLWSNRVFKCHQKCEQTKTEFHICSKTYSQK